MIYIVERYYKLYRSGWVFHAAYELDNKQLAKDFVSKKNLNSNSSYTYRVRRIKLK